MFVEVFNGDTLRKIRLFFHKHKMTTKSTNTTWHTATISRTDREKLHQHKSIVLWFTGLSGSGKSTLAHAVENYLHKAGKSTYVLDGDNIRHGLCSDLGFSDNDRIENIRRISETAKLLTEAGVITLTAFISPFKADRNEARKLFPHGDFIEIYCQCSIEICEKRDVKGLYKKARAGEIKSFTGIDSPYEAPIKPELIVNTQEITIEQSVKQVLILLQKKQIL